MDTLNKNNTKSTDDKISINVASCSWWNPWLEAAKIKSCEVLEFVKNDLNEISTAVKSEANSVFTTTANAFKDTFKLEEHNSKAYSVKKSVSSFLDSVSNALNPVPDDKDQEAIIIKNDIPYKLSSLQLKIHELINNRNTFLMDIEENLLPQYKAWLEIIDDQLNTETFRKQLVASPDLHYQYEVLVPEFVNHITFWKRFLFRKGLLEDEEIERQRKEKREILQVNQVQWDKEDFAQNIELSEEEQIRILSEFENEKKKAYSGGKSKKDAKQNESFDDLKVSLKQDLVIIGDSGSSQLSSSSGDTEGKDTGDDWEKDFELEDSDMKALVAVKK